jgi:hypothetical protein
MSSSNPDYDFIELRRLLAGHFNESLSDSEEQELGEILYSTPAARELYWQYLEIHAGLHWRLKGQKTFENYEPRFDSIAISANSAAQAHAKSSRSATNWLSGLSAAAVLLMAVGAILSAIYLTGRSNIAQDGKVVIGEVRPLTDSTWSFDKSQRKNRQDFGAGDVLRLDSGMLELRLTNNTLARLESPAVIKFISLDRARMLKGRVTVEVGEKAQGFIVETAEAEVVDLGTVFSVDVSDISTDVVVFEGKVDLKYPRESAKAGESILTSRSAQESRHINMGEAVRIAKDGTLSRIAQVRQTGYLEQPVPTVSSVRDNLQRVDMLNFYEIVPGGMNEDAQSFADRLHQWNGVDGKGIPSYLLGGDYVKTFNDDKVVDELEIVLTLDKPCMLYILMDTRTPAPPWLTAHFTNTGDVIGVDQMSPLPVEGLPAPHDSKYYLGDGAGRSVDKVHAVWQCKVVKPGEIVLGPNGLLLQETKEAGVSAGVNMYGIVVVPLISAGDL